MRARLHEESDLAQDHVVIEILVGAIGEEHSEDVSGHCVLSQTAFVELLQQRFPTGSGRDQKLLMELLKRRRHFLAHGVLVPGGMKERGSLAEFACQSHQSVGLSVGALGSIDAGNIRTEVDVDPETKFGEVEVSASEVGRQGSLQCGGVDLALVVAREVPAEQLPLDGAATGVCLAVQRQQHAFHQHIAFAVHGLHKAPVAQRLMGVLVAADAGGRIHGIRKAPDRWPRRHALRLRFFAAPGQGWAACRAQSVP